MRATTLYTPLLAAFAVPALSAYTVVDNYNETNFFTSFNFFNEKDPTNGSVAYATLPQAAQQKIAGFIPHQQNAIYLGIDQSATLTGGNRGAVRLESKKFYKHGLFVADVAHMPAGCSTWPAWWMVGKNWPAGGELDIVEGVNLQQSNDYTLHTGPNCAMDNTTSDQAAGVFTSLDCDVNNPIAKNIGCSTNTGDPAAFGAPFNQAGGGLWAVEWTSQAFKIWFWTRKSIPAELKDSTAATLDPAKWGKPAALFQGSKCNIDKSFLEMQMVINTSLCGGWAGAPSEWKTAAQCSAQAATCEEFVQKFPDAYKEAYWAINSIRTYS